MIRANTNINLVYLFDFNQNIHRIFRTFIYFNSALYNLQFYPSAAYVSFVGGAFQNCCQSSWAHGSSTSYKFGHVLKLNQTTDFCSIFFLKNRRPKTKHPHDNDKKYTIFQVRVQLQQFQVLIFPCQVQIKT